MGKGGVSVGNMPIGAVGKLLHKIYIFSSESGISKLKFLK